MKKILLVDDQRDQLSALKMLIKYSLSGVSVVTATSADTAIELLKSGDTDLVISDVNIGTVKGPAIKKLFPKVPFIYTTGNHLWKPKDGSPVIYKPFRHDEFFAKVKSVLGSAVSLRENIFRLTQLIANRNITVGDALKDLLEVE